MPMTFSAKRFNFMWLIVVGMMILLRLFSTRNALKTSCRFHLSSFNSMIYSIVSLNFIGVVNPVIFSHSFAAFFTGIACQISLTVRFEFFCFPMLLASKLALATVLVSLACFCCTRFALVKKAILTSAAFMKYIERFVLFASTTPFRYDFISHIRSLQRFWLESVVANTTTDSFIINNITKKARIKTC